MSLTQRLQISMAGLVALGTVLLGLGQPKSILPFLAIFAAGSSLFFTDFLGWFRLNRIVANIAAVVAAVLSLWNFFREPSQEQLLSIANLLSILLMILLYQEKNDRLYWQISVLSLLQVVVAAALNMSLFFGILLVIYTLVAMVTLMLFYLDREARRLAAAAPRAGSGASTLAERGAVSATRVAATSVPSWRVPAQVYQPISRNELEQPFLRGQLLSQTFSVGSSTLLFALILFYSVPRLSNSAWQGPSSARQRVSGFSPQISFDEMGEILQNREIVFRAEFYQENSREPYPVDQPYFRGAVLVDYDFDGEHSEWSPVLPLGMRSARRVTPAPVDVEFVRQEITFASSGVSSDIGSEPPLLFSTYPLYGLSSTPRSLRYDPRTSQLLRAFSDEAAQSTQYRYAVGTTAFRNGYTAALTPHLDAPPDKAMMRRLTTIDRYRFTGLVEIAQRILSREDLQGRSRRELALALSAHFLDPRAITLDETPRPYAYSLRPADSQRQEDLDPVEDFVVHHRSGHCEYFASALALMLRSQGIPARLALGYKGGEYNSVGGFWQIRQSHAHAWVEVYLEPQDVPPEALAPGEKGENGGWLLLDPTPPSEMAVSAARGEGLLGGLLDLFDYLQFIWNDYVVGLNSETQRRTMYPPVDTSAPGSFAELFSLAAWREFFANLARTVGLDPRALLRGDWFSWRAGLAAVVLCLALVGVVRGAGWLLGMAGVKRRRRRTAPKAALAPTIEFYRRLAALLARWGIERRPHQTQRELASAAAARLAASPAPAEVAAIPSLVVEAFYRVRFGAATLDKVELEQIEQALSSLEKNATG